MKKTLLLAAAVALALTACNKTNETETTDSFDATENVATDDAPTTGLRIAFVEVDSLMEQYKFCQDYNLLLTKKGENAQSTLQAKQRDLQNYAASIQKKYEAGEYTTRDELERAQASLERRQQELAELEQRLMGELANEQAQLTMELRDSIQAFLRSYNRDRKFDYILSRQGDNILFANPRYDITKDVVAGLNKRYKAKSDVQ